MNYRQVREFGKCSLENAHYDLRNPPGKSGFKTHIVWFCSVYMIVLYSRHNERRGSFTAPPHAYPGNAPSNYRQYRLEDVSSIQLIVILRGIKFNLHLGKLHPELS